VKYVVALTVNGLPYTWSFTVGAFAVATCSGATLTPDKASPQMAGTNVTFTATSTGCPTPQYRYYLQAPGGVWTVVRDYGVASWTWNTSGLASGSYLVDVWVRDSASGADYQAYQLMQFTIGAGCGGLVLTSDRASPQQVDYGVTFTATSSGCGNPEYLFYARTPAGAWTLMRGWGGATWAWDTSTVSSIGDYLVDVWVRPAGSGTGAQAYLLLPFTLTSRVCTLSAMSPNLASPQVHGAVVTFTATSAGCARPEFLYYLKGPGANAGWTVVQGYGGPAWTWSTAGVASVGTYQVDIWVRAVGSGVAEQGAAVISYTLT
jgi:hypothetical protein